MSDLKIVLPGNAPPGADEAGAQRVYTIAAGSGIDRVLRERVRQVLGEGYDAERDDAYVDGELVGAALAYAFSSLVGIAPEVDQEDSDELIESLWPDGWSEMKRKTSDRDLERAAALLLAELDRRDRLHARLAAGAGRVLS